MKKLPEHEVEVPNNLGKPPKGAVFKRVQAHELGLEFFQNTPKNLVFKETTPEDFDRLIAELKNELGKI